MDSPITNGYSNAMLEHATRHLGPASGFQPPVDGEGFAVAFHQINPLQNTALTLGVPFEPGARARIEFACSLQAGQESEAYHLVRLVARWFLSGDDSVDFGEWIQTPQPMIPDTAIHGLLFDSYPHGNETRFSVFDGAVWPDGADIPLRIFALIPLTRPEIEVLEDPGQGREALWKRWREEETEIWDIHRTGAGG
ncbi:hypothetical protein GCM10010191_53540 [Actinomadura vinacea]|uniref:Suppressor of fused-like domain-containing protein n=1 Tax=Actinomadura vinacea TaxID=115336 RepID=A0ABN3JL34_9ACTN